jgi:hypothetical protein
MDSIIQGYIVPWYFDTTTLMHWLELLMLAVTVLTVGGFAFAGFHALLSNRSLLYKRLMKSNAFDRLLTESSRDYIVLLATNSNRQEGKADEA